METISLLQWLFSVVDDGPQTEESLLGFNEETHWWLLVLVTLVDWKVRVFTDYVQQLLP